MKSKIILQVHDELIVDAPISEKTDVETMVVEEMEAAMKLKVRLKVDCGWGNSWAEAH